ncbi:MAG: DUF1287 domain-containing protein [Hyphomonas sp.]
MVTFCHVHAPDPAGRNAGHSARTRQFRGAVAALATRLALAARRQIGVTRSYDAAYVRPAYPMGDVDRSRGVCTDVIIRAYRDAFDVDLQKRVHEDMLGAFSDYPRIWGLSRPDSNIDHRRVPNLERFLERNGCALLPQERSGWQPGDLSRCVWAGACLISASYRTG